MTELLFKVVILSPLNKFGVSKYRPKVKPNSLKCPVSVFSCQWLVGVVAVKMTVVD